MAQLGVAEKTEPRSGLVPMQAEPAEPSYIGVTTAFGKTVFTGDEGGLQTLRLGGSALTSGYTWEVVSKLPADEFCITRADVVAWVEGEGAANRDARTAPSDFRHFSPEVPDSPLIPAHPCLAGSQLLPQTCW